MYATELLCIYLLDLLTDILKNYENGKNFNLITRQY